jgi:dihydrofolate synthase/folylpolyglutamate synthase
MDIEPQYQKALDYLYSFVDYSLTKTFRYSADKFDLGRMHALMAALGGPHQGYPAIHVAGTKGKGSVASMCASALQSGGYRVGIYTSPHLHDYAERIRLDGLPIPHEDLIALVEEIKPYVDAIPQLTTFEITTALAFLYFARQKVDAAVLEVGLGGRLDATNVVTPAVSVITSLSYDHTQYLGSTLAEIAGEKAGIIKPGVPVVASPQEDEALQVIEGIAAERGSQVFQVGRDFLFAPLSHSLDGQTLLVWSASEQELVDEYLESGGFQEWEPVRLTIPLLGHHQVQNAATAYTALRVYRERALPLSDAAIQRGFMKVEWPGRFEVLQRYPPVVIDSAHNRDSARKLRLALDDYFPGQPVTLVFGASEDKDISGMFAELMPRVETVIATQSFHPRAIEPERLIELAHQFGRPAKIVSDVAQALEEAIRSGDDDRMVLVAGSLFVAAGAREAWYARKGVLNEK